MRPDLADPVNDFALALGIDSGGQEAFHARFLAQGLFRSVVYAPGPVQQSHLRGRRIGLPHTAIYLSFSIRKDKMPLHSKHAIWDNLDDEIYSSADLSVTVPKYKFPQTEQDPPFIGTRRSKHCALDSIG